MAQAAPAPTANVTVDSDIERFYAAREARPLWVDNGRLNAAGEALLATLRDARLDGLDPSRYIFPELEKKLAKFSSGKGSADEVERALSRAFVAFVKDSRRAPPSEMVIADEWARPQAATTLSILAGMGAAPEKHIRELGWMHPVYRDLRAALAQADDPAEQQVLRDNLDRARLLPVAKRRYILVDAAAAQLIYYENGAPRASMRVIVGTAETETPMIASTIYWATLNPYWHVPGHLTREAIAPRVLKEGMRYFEGRGYEVVSEWSHTPQIIDPKTVDWKAVAAGRTEIKIRQKPGPGNGMGNVKFQFPNDLGIYLHDTPGKHLFEEASRDLSNGCVRLEDAEGLAKLLFGPEPVPSSDKAEDIVPLPEAVPVYLTYFTRFPENGRIAARKDIYARDGRRQAADAPLQDSKGAH